MTDLSGLTPVPLTGPCPDCGVEVTDKGLIHSDSCPISRATDAICAADKKFFEDHPNATHYYRPVDVGDWEALRMCLLPDSPAAGTWSGRVCVTKLSEDSRARNFDRVVFWPSSPEDLGQFL